MREVAAMKQTTQMSWDAPRPEDRPPHCVRVDGQITACTCHAAEAAEAGRAAEAAYRAEREHMPAHAVAVGAQGASTYAYAQALERPLSPCSDGSLGIGWSR